MEWIEIVKAFGPVFLAVVGLYISYKFSKSNECINNEKLERELFKEFNLRFDILNGPLMELKLTDNLEQLKSNSKLHKVVIDYFNLCAEEYFWFRKKRISKEIWMSWNAGMKFYFRTYPFLQELWKEEIDNEGYKSYYLKDGENLFN